MNQLRTIKTKIREVKPKIEYRTRKPKRTQATYKQLVRAVARDRFLKGRHFTQAEIKHVIDCFFLEFEKAIVNKEEVNIEGFGIFYRLFFKARKVVNPKTKKPLLLSGYYMLRFTPALRIKVLLGSKHQKESEFDKSKVAKQHKKFNAIIAVQDKVFEKEQIATDL